tara:strand:- start:360 stop:572 length:213 start_codon:yes stop_codon:yes gene_type:complete
MVFTILVLVLIFPRQAQAYIDPASGSVVVSAIISAIVALIVAVRTYWAKLVRSLKRENNSTQEPETNQHD